jgi:hypothetical protein
MHKKVFFILVASLFLPFTTKAATEPVPMNAGFISGIWYSTNSFYIGDKIRIYSAMQNNSGFDILGTMNFYDGKTLLGASDFSVVNGQLVERWTDWMVTPGTHNIFAKISNAQKSEIGKPPEPITLATEASATETITSNRLNNQVQNKIKCDPTDKSPKHYVQDITVKNVK